MNNTLDDAPPGHPAHALTAELTGELRSRLLDNLLDSADVGILLAEGTPSQEVVAVVNEKFCLLYGLRVEDLLHQPLKHFFQLISPRLVPDANSAELINSLLTRPIQGIEEEIVIQDAEVRHLSHNISSALTETGEAFGILYLVRDVSYSKHLENQAIHTQKMESIGTLAGGIAHDFNNILTAVLGYASSLKDDLADQPALTKKLDQIIRSSHRAADLTRNLLAFSRKNPHIPEVLDFNQLVRDTGSILEFAMPESIHMSLNLAPDLPLIEADRAQLQQVITHLALNARDAIFGTGNISLSTRVGIDSQAEDEFSRIEYVVLDVEDDGVGIPKENLSRVFEPFYTTKETGKGIGLGLAMAYGAIKQHFGFVEVESAPSLGSRFSIFIPSTSKPIKLKKNNIMTLPLPVSVVKARAIFVVDDEEDLRNLCKVALESEAGEIITAKDGAEAVEIFRLRKEDIELVILDLTMPNMSGAECFAVLREMNPELKVLISSGYSQDMGANDLLKAGAAGFLEKPYSISALLKSVKSCLLSVETPE